MSLTGRPQKELDREDEITASLTNLAYAAHAPRESHGRSSRFWFKLEITTTAVAKSKKAMQPKAVEHIDAEVEGRLASYKKEMPEILRSKVEKVREFFLTEIAPLTLASGGGNTQSKEVVQRLLDTDVDTAMFARFENMVNRAATIKMAEFTLEYFQLSKDHLSSILGQGGTSPPTDPLLKELLNTLREMPSKGDMKKYVEKVQQKRERPEVDRSPGS